MEAGSVTGIAVFSKKPVDLYERFVGTFIGDYIHSSSSAITCEPKPVANNYLFNRLVFYALENQKFGFSLMTPHNTDMDDSYVALFIPCSAAVVQAYLEYMHFLVDNGTPYNYADRPLCLTRGGGILTNSFYTDVEPRTVSSVFCSQAVVLGLRKALSDNQSALDTTECRLLQALTCNSRATDPTTLFRVLSEHGKVCDMQAFRKAFWKTEG
jgi:hypothetical protein